MVIWLNGSYGVGKSTVAEAIRGLLKENVYVIDSDKEFDIMFRADVNRFILDGGMLPQNNKRFLNHLKDNVKRYMVDLNNVYIVSMALTEKECLSELWNELVNANGILHYFILKASYDILVNRIKKDYKRKDKTLALGELNKSIQFISDNFKDVKQIDTDNVSVAVIAKKIIVECGIIQ